MLNESHPFFEGGILSVRLLAHTDDCRSTFGASNRMDYIAFPIETRLRPLCFA